MEHTNIGYVRRASAFTPERKINKIEARKTFDIDKELSFLSDRNKKELLDEIRHIKNKLEDLKQRQDRIEEVYKSMEEIDEKTN